METPTAGELVLRGIAKGTERVRVKVFDSDGRLLQQNDGLVTESDQFYTGLRDTLAAGQIVLVSAVEQGRETFSSSPMLVKATRRVIADAALLDNRTGPGTDLGAVTTRIPEQTETATASTPVLYHVPAEPAKLPVNHDQPESASASVPFAESAVRPAPPSPKKPQDKNNPAIVPANVTLAPGATQTFTFQNPPPPKDLQCNVTDPPSGCQPQWELSPSAPDGGSFTRNAANPFEVTYTAPPPKGAVATTGPVKLTATIVSAKNEKNVAAADITLVSSKAGNASDANAQTTPAAVDFITGHVRYYFTFGVVLSQQGNDFSQTNPFLDFQLDKTWWTLHGFNGCATASCANVKDNKLARFRLNTFFDTRLTAVGSSEIGSTNASTATPTGTSAVTPAAYNSYLTTRKAGALQVGVYAPYELDPDRQYSVYLAPIFKAGFVTPIDTSSQTTTTGAGTAVSTGIVSPQKYFTNATFGLRLGETQHVLLKADCIADGAHGNAIATDPHGDTCIDTTLAPTNSNYLDVSIGRFGNFQAFDNITPSAAVPTLLRQSPFRLAIEGALQIPNQPFVLGVSANVSGFGRVRAGYIAPQDDLRFFVGFKFDAKKVITALVNAGQN